MTTPDEPNPQQGKSKKQPPANLVIPPKKPKLTKAERRALQEAQRAKKAAASLQAGAPPKGKKPATPAQSSQQPEGEAKAATLPAAEDKTQKEDEKDKKTVSLFSHLTPYHDTPVEAPPHLHPAVIQLGRAYKSGQIRGGNARCRAMLHVLEQVLEDYIFTPTSQMELRQHFQLLLKNAFTYWTTCRPHSVSMGNAFTFLKTAVATLERDVSLETLKSSFQETLEAYRRERIEFADKAIAQFAAAKLRPDDVVLTYGHSEVVQVILSSTKVRKVICVDSRPLEEGKRMLQALQTQDYELSYVSLNAITYVLKDVTRVLLGASALMSDGSVLGRVGTACVALAAQAQNIPVLVCCETYKISNRVQLESITANELGNPDSLGISKWRETPNLKALNLLYDLTPSEFVSAIVTELGMLPPTSVAVLLREMNPQDSAFL